MKLHLKLVLIIIVTCFSLKAQSASLIAVCKNLSKSTNECDPKNFLFATYSTSGNIFNYKIDRGGIGEISESDAKGFAEEVLGLWESHSGIDFQTSGDGFINVDVNETNYAEYLNTDESLGYSPVIWDESGELMDELYGIGAKYNILGFAVATFFDTTNDLIIGINESVSVFNGYLFNGENTGEDSETTINTFKTTILHEFGHMFGLDHTQGGNIEGFKQYNEGELEASEIEDIPVMFPIAANPLVELQQDDIAAVRLGYPKGDENTLYGKITGRLKYFNTGIKGANVVAYLIDDENPRKRAVACPSDVNGLGEGSFTLPNLAPGKYIIKAEPLYESFTGGSSIGIHQPIDPTKLKDSYYKGEGQKSLESQNFNQAVSSAFQINVSAGSNTNINFKINLASFTIRSNKLRNTIKLNRKKSRIFTFQIRNYYPNKRRRLKFSTDYPNLIKFISGRKINFKGKFYTVKVRLSSYNKFLKEFPEIQNNNISIPLTIEDLKTGYKLDTESFLLF